ncbi:MAG: amidohydrolase [Clostridia bacterium]|nr:amidohydrolase [Clostridia bacterium]
MINQYTVIDAHCHVYPEKIAARAVESTDHFYDTHAHGQGTVADLLAVGEAAGCDGYVIQSVASTPHHVESINRFIAAAIAADISEAESQGHSGKLTGLGTLHPDHPDLKGAVEDILSHGLHGVKLHPDMQKFCIDDERAYPIYQLCVEYDLPILMHMGDPRFDYSHPDRLYRVLTDFPTLTVVAAHMGGWANWDYACDRLSDFQNLYVDTSSSMATAVKDYGIQPHVTSLTPAHTAALIRRWGAEKVLFGTDYPMWSQADDLAVFFEMGLTEAENRMILAENAKRVFRIQ